MTDASIDQSVGDFIKENTSTIGEYGAKIGEETILAINEVFAARHAPPLTEREGAVIVAIGKMLSFHCTRLAMSMALMVSEEERAERAAAVERARERLKEEAFGRIGSHCLSLRCLHGSSAGAKETVLFSVAGCRCECTDCRSTTSAAP